MTKKLKKILIIISIVLASILLVGFILYKIFVTPEVKVMLSLVNARNDISTSFNFYIDNDEKSVLNYAFKKSGTSTYDLTLSESPMFEGASASLVTNGNRLSSASELKFNRFIYFNIYTGKSETLVNLPIVDIGIRIPKETKKEDWTDSAFFDAYNALPHTQKPDFIKFISDNNIDINDVFDATKPELINLVKQIDVSKKGNEKVKIGDKEEKAEVFSINLSKTNMNKLADIFESYLKKREIEMPDYIRQTLISFAQDNTLLLKIKSFNIYEAEIVNKDKDTHTLVFSDNKNQFNNVSYLKNNELQFRRVRTEKSGKTTDVLTINNKDILTLERDKDNSSLVFDYGTNTISIKGSGMELTENKLSYDDLKIKIGDSFELSGRYSLEKRTSSTPVEFNKAKEYIDATIVTKEKLDSIISSFTGFLDKIPFF